MNPWVWDPLQSTMRKKIFLPSRRSGSKVKVNYFILYTNLMDISYTTKRRPYLLCLPNVNCNRFCCCSLNAFYHTFNVSIKMKLELKIIVEVCQLTKSTVMIFIQLESKISLRWNNSFSYLLQNKNSSNYLICNSYRLALQSIQE